MKTFRRLGTTPTCFQFDFVLHGASNIPSNGTVFISLTRGGKVAIGKAAAISSDHTCKWQDEKLSLIATLYKEGKAANFQEKTARISAKESLGKKGTKKFGEKTFNLADYASMNGSKEVEIVLNEGGTVEKEQQTGIKLAMTIHCQWIKDDVHKALDQSSEVSDMTHTMDRASGDVSDEDDDGGGGGGGDHDDDHHEHHHHHQEKAVPVVPVAAAGAGGATALPPKMKKPVTFGGSSSSSSSGTEKELDILLQKYRDLENQNKAMEQKLQNATKERDALANELQISKDQQVKDGKRIDKLLQRLDEAEKEKEEHQQQQQQPHKVVTSSDVEKERELQAKITVLNKELDALHAENDKTIKDIQDKYAEERKNLSARAAEAEKQAAASAAALKEGQEKWTDEKKSLLARVSDSDHKKAEALASRFTDDDDDDGNLSDEEVGKKKGGSAKPADIKEVQKENASLKSAVATKDKQLREMDAERNDLVQSLVTTKLAFAESQEQVDVLKKKLNTAVNDKLKISQRMTALEVKVVEASKNKK